MTGQTYYTADLHLGHQKVAQYRGYTDSHTHDRAVLARIRSTVHKGDHLWICGDISSGSTGGFRYALERLNELTPICYLHLIAGNHDPVHPQHRDAHKYQGEFFEVFSSIAPYARRKINGHNVWLSHFPWLGMGDRGEGPERYPDSRLRDNGEDLLLHGHLHSSMPYSSPRSIDVGLDAWDLKPVPHQLLEQMLPKKKAA